MAPLKNTPGVTWRSDLEGTEWMPEIEPERWPALVAIYRRRCKQEFANDCRGLISMVEGARRCGWAGYESEDRYIEDGLGVDPDAVRWAMAGLQYLKAAFPDELEKAQALGLMIDLGHRRVEAMRLGATVEAAKRQGEHGAIGKGAVSTFQPKGSTHAKTLTARLRRDHPGIADRLAAGEFPSVRAACRAAGIKVAQTATIRTDDVARAVAVLLRHFPIEAVVEAIQKGR